MTDENKPNPDVVPADKAAKFLNHMRTYIETDGAEGYLRDMTHTGGTAAMPHLILRTEGRKSGREFLVPLLYAAWADEYVIVASKGGADTHPAWYLNLLDRPEVEWQVRNKRFSGTWHVAESDERAVLWDYLTHYLPSYATYQSLTERVIPVIVLTPTSKIEERWTLPAEDA